MIPDLRTPVIVGVGQLRSNRDRTVAEAREPLALLVDALQRAAKDADAPSLLADADAVYAVRIASWAYTDLASQVATAVAASPRTTVSTGLGGQHPVRLLDQAGARIWSGESDIALVVAAEAQASVSLLGKAGVDPVADLGWSTAPGGPPAFDLEELGSAAMQAAGLLAPTRVYPLFENRLQSDLGLTPQEALAWSARLYADLALVAADQPAAWIQEPLTAQEIETVSATNRMVCEPYPLAMNAMPHVDQAAAVIVTSLGTARAYGVPDDALVFLWGGAGVDDEPDVLARPGFGESRALALVLDRCLEQASTSIADVDLIDVYSCFPVVPKLVGLHLGLPRDAVLSVTGGHSSFGGPLNSYSLHAVATMTQRLRDGARVGLVHANGGYLTYEHAVLLGTAPHPEGYVGQPEPQRIPSSGPRSLGVADLSVEIEAVIETATVEHNRSGQPSQAFFAATTATGERLAASTPRGDAQLAGLLSLDALPAGLTTQVGRRVRVTPLGNAVAVST